jgi:ureidoglycolate dehydrogenase (NAD+)
MKEGVTLSADHLTAIAAQIFEKAGMSPAHAATVAAVLVWADLRGAPSHGVQRIGRYLEIIDAGEMNVRPDIRIEKDLPGAVLIEGDRGPGQVTMSFAAGEATRKAKSGGIGMAVVRHTTHTGALGYYTRLAALDGVIALAGSASWPNMAYHGTAEVGIATNPFSIAAPRGSGEPLILDMATGVVALGKIVHAARTGKSIPDTWALDKHGKPTTDPKEAALPLPLGGPKGAGLSLMIELIASLLVGNPIIVETLEKTENATKHRQNAFLIAINVASFGAAEDFAASLERTVKDLKALPRQDGFAEILMPGERGARELAERQRSGITIPAATWKEVTGVAKRFGVSVP